MGRRLVNLATLLSLSLLVASVAAWTRSQYVSEAWGLAPQRINGPRAVINRESRGWERWRLLGSAEGRLVWVSADEMLIVGRASSYSGGGYRAREFMPPEWRTIRVVREVAPTGRAHGRIPGVAEWASLNMSGGLRYVRVVTVSWLVPAFAGAFLPAARLWRWYWWRAPRGPAFPVLSTTS